MRDAGVGVGRGQRVGAPRREGRVRQEPAGAARSGMRGCISNFHFNGCQLLNVLSHIKITLARLLFYINVHH